MPAYSRDRAAAAAGRPLQKRKSESRQADASLDAPFAAIAASWS